MTSLVLLTVTIVVILRAVYCFRAHQIQRATVSSFAVGVYVFCLWIPAYLQASGAIHSKLFSSGLLSRPTAGEISELELRWALELFCLLLAEIAIVEVIIRTQKFPRSTPSISVTDWRKVSLILVIVGVLANMVFPADIGARGVEGQGIFVLLRTMLVCGLAIAAYFNCWRSRWIWFGVVLGVAFLIFQNIRSPLLIVLVAFIAGVLSRGDIYRRRKVSQIVAAILVASIAGSFMSGMRANLTRDLGFSSSEVAANVLSSPVESVYEAGLDTLDGYRFSHLVSEFEEPRPSDLLTPVTTLVPRSIWHEKPNSISVDLSAKYLGYKASGQYLSPVGYLTLTSGSYIFALLLLMVFGGLMSWLVLRLWKTFWLSIVLVVLLRFLYGGSGFDLYYGLMLTLTTGIGIAIWHCVFRDRSNSAEAVTGVKYANM